jgi:hypothetical protein
LVAPLVEPSAVVEVLRLVERSVVPSALADNTQVA